MRPCSKSSPDLAWRNHTRSPIDSIGADGPVQRGLHLAGALEPGQVQARAEPTEVGSRSAPAAPEADEAAAVHGRDRRARDAG